MFAKTPSAFKAHQPSICADALHKFKPDAWAAANTKLQEDVQERRLQQQVKVERSSGDSPPGFLPLPAKWESVSAVCKLVQVVDGSAAPRTVVMFQLVGGGGWVCAWERTLQGMPCALPRDGQGNTQVTAAAAAAAATATAAAAGLATAQS